MYYKAKRKLSLVFLILSIIATSSITSFGANTSCYNEPPVKLLDSTIDKFLGKLDKLKKPSLSQVRSLIQQDVEPHANFNITARLVLGPEWRKISSSQKQQFVKNLRNMILNTYGSAFTNYSGEKIEIKCPIKYNRNSDKVEIDTKVTHPQKQGFILTYRLYKKGNDWILYDIIIDNVSIVHSYRQTVRRLIDENRNFDKVLDIMAKKGNAA